MIAFKKLSLAAVGFVLGATLVLALEGALLVSLMWLLGVNLVPRGLGWVVMPIVGGVFGARVGYTLGDPGTFLTVRSNLANEISHFGRTATVEKRLWLAFSALWVLSVIVVFLVFDPLRKISVV